VPIFNEKANADITMTVSIGVASFEKSDQSAAELL
jgi:GGDEF domain-containing protein